MSMSKRSGAQRKARPNWEMIVIVRGAESVGGDVRDPSADSRISEAKAKHWATD